MPSTADAPGRATRTSLKVGPLLFFSGLCALVYQVAWQREFRLIFGASTAASAAVLAIFIGGLGAGGLALGARVDRSPRPLSFYARLEIGIAISAGATPLLFKIVRPGYLALGGVSTLGTTGATLVRLLFATLVLAVPTTLMGGTLPAVSRAVSTQRRSRPARLALLYGINTLGAVAGALVSTFFMLEVFGTRLTLIFAAPMNLLLGVVANALGRSVDRLPKDEPSEGAAAEAPAADDEPRPPIWFTLAASGTVGFAFFLMELVWYRMLAPILGGTVFTFGLILAQRAPRHRARRRALRAPRPRAARARARLRVHLPRRGRVHRGRRTGSATGSRSSRCSSGRWARSGSADTWRRGRSSPASSSCPRRSSPACSSRCSSRCSGRGGARSGGRSGSPTRRTRSARSSARSPAASG